MNLLSFVPKSLWASWCKPFKPTYSVEAAADGLVCISTRRECHCYCQGNEWYERSAWETWDQGWNSKPSHDTYCVLNPVTRTCKVLPQVLFEQVLWLPPTSTALTILGYVWDKEHKHKWDREEDDNLRPTSGWNREVLVATYDLTASGSGGWDVVTAYKSDSKQWGPPLAALCSGETFVLDGSRLHVLAPGPCAGERLVEVAALTEPSLAMLGVDLNAFEDPDSYLVAHRGAVFLVKALMRSDWEDAVVCVWRLARKQLEWEAVTRLDLAEVNLLTAGDFDGRSMALRKLDACGVREFLCVRVGLFFRDESQLQFFLAFNLDTGKWEVLNHEAIHSGNVSCLFELQPNLFLTRHS